MSPISSQQAPPRPGAVRSLSRTTQKKKVSFLLPFYEILPVMGIYKTATSGMCSGELSVVGDTDSKAEAPAKTGSRVKSKNCSGDNSGLLSQAETDVHLRQPPGTHQVKLGVTSISSNSLLLNTGFGHILHSTNHCHSGCSQAREVGPPSYPQLCCPAQKADTALS